MEATYKRYLLKFKHPGGTSRGFLQEKETWFIFLKDGTKRGIGECGLFRGLSADDRPDYESKLKMLCNQININEKVSLEALKNFPSIQMGYEMAILSLKGKNPFELFPSKFTEGNESISINGLIWMGEIDFMKAQIKQKINEGFNCLKLKIGALPFEKELKLLEEIRNEFSMNQIIIRVDANGGFYPHDVMDKLIKLANLDIHSIEQPIRANQRISMSSICSNSPIPVALDEELIGIFDPLDRKKLLDQVSPQYIILKPSLLGGFKSCEHWIELADQRSIGWWVTSALESNIGLNAIAQWTYQLGVSSHQGLGTGDLFTNNIDSPLQVKLGQLNFNNNIGWSTKF
tara:strand:- start:443 stop:1477 length:1035 start_codon:yes stop_codon:yes gene_type:complete